MEVEKSMKAKELRDFNRDDQLHDTLLTLAFSEQLIDGIISDTKIELKEMQRIKKSIVKKLQKGQEFYKKKHGREAVLKTK